VQADTSSKHDNKALILVVEREAQVRALELFFLEKAGFAVEFCDDGAEALERAKSIRPDILISEILVPSLDGLAVCRAIKSNPETCHIIVVMFSILAAEDRARAAGADAFLRKPLNDAKLLATVRKLLPKRATQGIPAASKGVDDGSR
jgi:CheY-like chemotaxis protein